MHLHLREKYKEIHSYFNELNDMVSIGGINLTCDTDIKITNQQIL